MPRLIPCSSSPPAGDRMKTNMSTSSATAVSAWPTPTVSTNIASNPAASHSKMASRVRRAMPPGVSPAEDGRMKASGARANSAMRVLSPRIAPPPRFEAGSTASTAMRRPSAMPARPNRSMKVDLPAPGGPEMPMRTALPVSGSSASIIRSASPRWSGREDSTRVMARASARRSPRRSAWSSAAPVTPSGQERRTRRRACGARI